MAKKVVQQEELGSTDEIFRQPESAEAAEPAEPEQVEASVETSGQQELSGAGEQEQETPSLLDILRSEYGVEAEDEHTALERVVDRFGQTRSYVERMSERLQTLEQQNRELITHLTGRQQQAQPAQQTQQQVEREPESPWRRVNPLSIPPKLVQAYRTPDGGWRDNTPAEILTEVERYQNDVEGWINSAMQDPEKFFGPGIEATVRKLLGTELQQHEVKRTTQTRYQQMQQEVGQFAYAVNPATGRVDGQMLSEFGMQFTDAIIEAEQMIREQGREPTQEESFQLAYWRMQPVLSQLRTGGNGQQQTQPQQPQQPTPTPEQVREQRRKEHMRQQRAAGVAQTAGTTAGGLGETEVPRRKQNPLLNIGSEFSESLFADGFG